jgi:hypothetical protein
MRRPNEEFVIYDEIQKYYQKIDSEPLLDRLGIKDSGDDKYINKNINRLLDACSVTAVNKDPEIVKSDTKEMVKTLERVKKELKRGLWNCYDSTTHINCIDAIIKRLTDKKKFQYLQIKKGLDFLENKCKIILNRNLILQDHKKKKNS